MSELIIQSIKDAIPLWVSVFMPIVSTILIGAILVIIIKFLIGSVTKTYSRILGESTRETRAKIKRNNNIIDLIVNLFKFKS